MYAPLFAAGVVAALFVAAPAASQSVSAALPGIGLLEPISCALSASAPCAMSPDGNSLVWPGRAAATDTGADP